MSRAAVPPDYFFRGETPANRQRRPATKWKVIAHHANGIFLPSLRRLLRDLATAENHRNRSVQLKGEQVHRFHVERGL